MAEACLVVIFAHVVNGLRHSSLIKKDLSIRRLLILVAGRKLHLWSTISVSIPILSEAINGHWCTLRGDVRIHMPQVLRYRRVRGDSKLLLRGADLL